MPGQPLGNDSPAAGSALAGVDLRRILGHCPEELPGTGARCWKFLRPEPDAPHDFWLLVAIVPVGPGGLLSMVVPHDDGGLSHFTQLGEVRRYLEETYVRRMSSDHKGFGPVSVSKLKVRTHYERLQQVFAQARFRIGRFGPDLVPLGPYEEVGEADFPPLPASLGEASPAGAARSLVPVAPDPLLLEAQDLPNGYAVYCPSVDTGGADDPGEWEVAGAEEVPGGLEDFRSVGADAAGRPPGIYCEIAHSGGDPGLGLVLWWHLPEGAARADYLAGDACEQLSYERFRQKVIVKKKSSIFGSRKKIIVIREQIRREEVVCKPIP
jgi:hypothetical protein